MPSEDQALRYYREASAPEMRVDAAWIENRVSSRANRRRLASLRRYLGGGRLLDIGCGKGFFLALAGRCGWSPYGLEASAAEIEFAVRHLGLRNFFNCAWPMATPPAMSFDAASMFHVIEHLPNPTRALGAALALLKPHGLLVVETPNVESWPALFFGRRWAALDAPRHLVLFSRRALARCAEAAGLEILELTSYSPSTMEYSESLRYLLRRGAGRPAGGSGGRARRKATACGQGGRRRWACRQETLDRIHSAENAVYRMFNRIADRCGRGANLLMLARPTA